MSDLIERLRHAADCQWKDVVDDCQEAADEIERLKEQIELTRTISNLAQETLESRQRQRIERLQAAIDTQIRVNPRGTIPLLGYIAAERREPGICTDFFELQEIAEEMCTER